LTAAGIDERERRRLQAMKTARLEAFSDGVFAVIITIMVLELKPPKGQTLAALESVVPSLLVYALSFMAVAIMWVNHHHMLGKALKAEPALLWANNCLLFWMSLIPFVTANLGENDMAPVAIACYGAVFAFTSAAFLLLLFAIDRQDRTSPARRWEFMWMKRKAVLSAICYASTVGLAHFSAHLCLVIFVLFPAFYFWPEGKHHAAH
jgi:uncharacterized membrane protein